ncbi:MAG: hypothetical protein U9Q58_05265, partial [Pseudomonadota bacterium]|nr:hypothetical protein [Pseudomonadota bacterium]
MLNISASKAGSKQELDEAVKFTRHEAQKGIILGFIAYVIWGSFPAFFKLLPDATPLEIVSHRIFWSAIFLSILVL